jgi:glutathione peroxidase
LRTVGGVKLSEEHPSIARRIIPMSLHFPGLGEGSVLLLSFLVGMAFVSPTAVAAEKSIYEFTMKDINGKDVPLGAYKGKVILLVNVASQCGNTPQYKDLEALYLKYRARGFVVLGFPANNFGEQEPGTDAEIKKFCTSTYNVTFPMFSKISVKGDDQHPLYRLLTSKDTDPEFAGDVKWNFQKYLISRDGKIIARFAPKLNPMSEEVTTTIEKALGTKGK